MTSYRAPLRDILFVLRDLVELNDIADMPDFGDCTPDVVESVLGEAGRIAEDVLAPLNHQGDQQGARRENGRVVTPDGWDRAYRTLVDGNWIGLSCPPEYGGMGLPEVLNAAVSEMWQAANMAFALCPMLTQGAINAIGIYADEGMKARYLPRLVSGEWTGTMNLTEAAAGSDLGAIRTRAVGKDGHYLITGQKIFITYGEHDLAENIIHLVLARTPDAPPGVKGISLFVVPKFLTGDDGAPIGPNDVQCVSLEHKLGIHASPTAVLSFGAEGGAVGYLVGEENRGLEYMFVMMNHARLNVGLQGLAIAERAYQQARAYAGERVQGRPLGADGPAPIADHPDVRRMLMGMKAEIEAMRALAYRAAAALDRAHAAPDPSIREASSRRAEFLIPIVKGWCTERGVEIASMGVQIHGGTGYIEATGAAQHLRDARITPIYEGTTAIQANDLVNRKILKDGGAIAIALLEETLDTARGLDREDPILRDIGNALSAAVDDAMTAVRWLLDIAGRAPCQAAAAGVPLLHLLGTVLGGHDMARAARICANRTNDGEAGAAFPRAKIATAWHYAEAILPRTSSLREAIVRGSRTVMALNRDDL